MKIHFIHFIKFLLNIIIIPVFATFGVLSLFIKIPLQIIELGSLLFDDIFAPHIPKIILKIFPFLKSQNPD